MKTKTLIAVDAYAERCRLTCGRPAYADDVLYCGDAAHYTTVVYDAVPIGVPPVTYVFCAHHLPATDGDQ